MSRASRAEQLRQVAEDVIAERGIAATSMDDVAAAAGVTKPVVYDHFGSKDGLVAALVEAAGHELAAAVMTSRIAATNPEDALARGLRAYFRFMRTRRKSWTSLLTETAGATAGAAAALERVRDEQAELIARLLADDVAGCDLRRARWYAQIVVGASERLATRPGAASVETLTRHMMDILWLGLDEVREGGRWQPGGSRRTGYGQSSG